MIINIAVACSIGLLSAVSPIYGLGFLSLTFVTHGMLYELLGSSAQHLPFYCALAATPVLLFKVRLQIRQPNMILILLALFSVMSISTIFSSDSKRSFIFLYLYAKGFLLCIVTMLVVREERDFYVLSKLLLLGVFIGALATLYQYHTGTFTISTGMIQRAASLRGDPNDTAMLLMVGLPLAVYWTLHGASSRVRIINMVTLAFILAGIMLTKSRGGFVTLAIVIGILYFKNHSTKTAIWAFMLLIGIVIFGAATDYWDRVDTLRTGEEKGRSLEGRINLVKGGTVLFLQNSLLGVGPGQFGQNYLKWRVTNSSGIGLGYAPSVAHNLFLEFAVENGIFGITLLLIIFYLSLRGFFGLARADPNNPYTKIMFYLGVSFTGLLIAGLFLSQGKNSVLWYLIGLGLSANDFIGHSIQKD